MAVGMSSTLCSIGLPPVCLQHWLWCSNPWWWLGLFTCSTLTMGGKRAKCVLHVPANNCHLVFCSGTANWCAASNKFFHILATMYCTASTSFTLVWITTMPKDVRTALPPSATVAPKIPFQLLILSPLPIQLWHSQLQKFWPLALIPICLSCIAACAIPMYCKKIFFGSLRCLLLWLLLMWWCVLQYHAQFNFHKSWYFYFGGKNSCTGQHKLISVDGLCPNQGTSDCSWFIIDTMK